MYLAGAEKSPQRSKLGFDWTTVFELLLSSSNRQAGRTTEEEKEEKNTELIKNHLQTDTHFTFFVAWSWKDTRVDKLPTINIIIKKIGHSGRISYIGRDFYSCTTD